MAQSKATKKFEKRRLKDTLERRNSVKKTKQRQQLKERKKSRRAEENGEDSKRSETAEQDKTSGVPGKNPFEEMTVDDFFQGGFEIPQISNEKPTSQGRKRKRPLQPKSQEDSEDSLLEEPVPDASTSESDSEDEDHQAQLDALATNDPEFHKFLEENEPELLKGVERALEALSEDDDTLMPSDSEVETNKVSANELTKSTVAKWRTNLTQHRSLRTAKEVVLAFRAAALGSGSEHDDQQFKYSISDPEVYHQLLTLALTEIPETFQHQLPVQENQRTGKVRVETEGKKFKGIAPLLKSHVGSIVELLGHLSDAGTLRLTVSATLPLLPYMLSFKKLVRDLIQAVTAVWSQSSQAEGTRVAAFLVLRRLHTIGDAGIRESVLKAAYQALVQSSRQTTAHTLAGINLMKNTAAELWGLDAAVGYTTAFTFVRQLAMHLRGTIQRPTPDGHRAVYNWQYTHSLDFWSRVLSAHCGVDAPADAPLRPLIYPLVQVTLGALNLSPTAAAFPLHLHLVRSLLRLNRATNTYIPLAAPLCEILSSAELRRPGAPSTLPPLDLSLHLRAPRAHLHTRPYQDAIATHATDLLAAFLAPWSAHIAFPELALAPLVLLKRRLREASASARSPRHSARLPAELRLLVQKIESSARAVEARRAAVAFAPRDRRAVDAFAHDVQWQTTPLGAFVDAQRRAREERERLLAHGRAEQEARPKAAAETVKGGKARAKAPSRARRADAEMEMDESD